MKKKSDYLSKEPRTTAKTLVNDFKCGTEVLKKTVTRVLHSSGLPGHRGRNKTAAKTPPSQAEEL